MASVLLVPGRDGSEVLELVEEALDAVHPTVKPTALVADAIQDVTRRGDLVLDTFLGSGTSLIACERSGRRFRGLEIDPAYVDVAISRWTAMTGRTPRRISRRKSK